jgi:two-component system response regulator NreC
MAIRIVVADDHTLIRETLSAFLRQQEDMEVVGEAADGPTVMELTERLQPDVVVMDVSMPPALSGLEATRWIAATWPNVKVVALSMYASRRYVAEMLKAGARAYLLKDVDFDNLATAVRTVAEGRTYISSAVVVDPAVHQGEAR